MLIQLKQQCASPPICCEKNSLGHSTDRTALRLLGAIQFQSMLADIGWQTLGRVGETEICILGAKPNERRRYRPCGWAVRRRGGGHCCGLGLAWHAGRNAAGAGRPG